MGTITKLDYIKNNIELIQTPKKWESKTKVKRARDEIPFRNKTELKNYLFSRINKFPQKKIETIYNDWGRKKFVIARIEDLAIKYFVYHKHLKDKLKFHTKKQLESENSLEKLEKISKELVDRINDDFGDDIAIKAIKNEILKSLPENLYFGFLAGFYKNLTNIKEGEDSTFFGQAAQFLFLGRALRAGFNASNVDLPSSKYDAILDNGKKTVKIQVKGFEGTSLSFFTRARGGQGIDSTDITNQKIRITSKMCDYYVGVSHRVGTCYIIPMFIADKFPSEKAKNVKISELQDYKEAWHLFEN